MNPIEIKFLIWACLTLLSIIAFVGILFINAFMKMAKDINTIKTTIQVQSTKHDSLEQRVEKCEHKLKMS
jgi:cell division protein FtsL